MLVSLVMGGILTVFWGRVYVRDVNDTLRERFFKDMYVKAREGRIRIDNYVKLHHYSAELFLTQKKFLDYLELNSPATGDKILRHASTPPWFPDRSIQRTFVKARHFILTDVNGNVREMFSRSGYVISEALLDRIKLQSALLSAKESWITNLDEGMYFVASQALDKAHNPAWGRLVLATPINDEFILASQGLVQSASLLALIDEDTQDVLVSSDLEVIPQGRNLEALSDDYLVESSAFFDYGNSEVILKLALLVPKQELQDLFDQVERKAILQILLISFTFIVTFTLIFLWFIRRMDAFARDMVGFSRDKLGIFAPTVTSGGPLERVQSQFQRLSEAFLQTRRREEKANKELLETNAALLKSLETVKYAQAQLTQSETMAALGGLVAGVSHEINTPLGIGFTSSTFLRGKTQKVLEVYERDELTRADLEEFFEVVSESTRLIETNLSRANDLVRSFKRVAVDQSSNDRRTFNMKKYAEEILVSLRPKWKHTKHTVQLHCPDDLEIDGFPGAVSQIFSNLIINSLNHAFPDDAAGNISIAISRDEGGVHMRYRDDGKGMEPAEVKRIFEPFFTTARNRGGSGLGMHIVDNLVTQTMGGSIECSSKPGEGVEFSLRFPIGGQGAAADLAEDMTTNEVSE